MSSKKGTFVVVGGGVAGVCCVEELVSLMDGEYASTSEKNSCRIIFVSGCSGFIKVVTNSEKLGQVTESFGVKECQASSHYALESKVCVVQEDVVGWNAEERVLHLSDSSKISFDELCIATGATAKQIFNESPNVLRIRDTETIGNLQRRLVDSRRVLLVGNGGIATELVFELNNVEVVWAIRHSSISATYFDEAAAKFFESRLSAGRAEVGDAKPEVKVNRYTVVREKEAKDGDNSSSGCALGPHWLGKLHQSQGVSGKNDGKSSRRVHVIRDVELERVYECLPSEMKAKKNSLPAEFLQSSEWKVWAELSNGEVVGCDLVIEATGVQPNSGIWKRDCDLLEIAKDGGILVDEQMKTSVDGVYAAGDVCTAGWGKGSAHWEQIRLWTQAKQMGIYCARAMVEPSILLDIAFDLFSHVTTFFGYKVVLLGDFSGARLEKPFKVHFRITDQLEYIKVLSKNSRIQGAVLIGETELEETMENLILNQTNVAEIEDYLLDPGFDLEDYFD